MSAYPGCGCALCRREVPNPEVQDVITATMRQDAYAAGRARWRALVGVKDARSPSEAVRTAWDGS